MPQNKKFLDKEINKAQKKYTELVEEIRRIEHYLTLLFSKKFK